MTPDCMSVCGTQRKTRICDVRGTRTSPRKKDPNYVNITTRFSEKTVSQILDIADSQEEYTSVSRVVRSLVEQALAAGMTV